VVPHAPAVHVALPFATPGHLFAQVPQLFTSWLVSMQALSQRVYGELHL
jgi:hypothetical protein